MFCMNLGNSSVKLKLDADGDIKRKAKLYLIESAEDNIVTKWDFLIQDSANLIKLMLARSRSLHDVTSCTTMYVVDLSNWTATCYKWTKMIVCRSWDLKRSTFFNRRHFRLTPSLLLCFVATHVTSRLKIGAQNFALTIEHFKAMGILFE